MSFIPKMGLSKSKYTTFCCCPKKLWLSTYHPEYGVISEASKRSFERGNQVGDLAMGLLGPFEEVTTFEAGDKGKLDYAAMIKKTMECMNRGIENICEASFSFEGNYCAVDILHKVENGYAIYEVKSSTDSDDGKDEILCYAEDIAYQKYVLENCGLNIVGVYLVRINHDYVLGEELDVFQLFSIKDMSELVAAESVKIAQNIKNARNTLSRDVEPDIGIGRYCEKPYECNFHGRCFNFLPTLSIFDFYNSKKKWKYIEDGKFALADIRNEKMSAAQKIVVEGLLDNKPHIDKAGIQTFLTKMHYPLYFFDFESMMSAIPQFKGTKPYQQVCFQYSLHIVRSPGTEPEHREFLAKSGEDPLRKIAENICKDIPKGACMVVYNAGFEKGRIKELAQMFPDLADHLLGTIEDVVDLLDLFRAGHYYLPTMGSSFSVKSVLPALFPDDPELDYHNLEGVHRGDEAADIFPKIKDMPPEEAARARQNLLDYCKLDTYAMVKIVNKLNEVVQGG